MAKKKESEDGNYNVGDQIKAKLHDGRKVDATVRAVFQQDDETKLNIDILPNTSPKLLIIIDTR